MPRALIGWELGANRGHAERLRVIGRTLLDLGFEVTIALQQIDALGLERDARLAIVQAPVWPRLLVNAAQDHARPVASMGDILGRLGLDRPGCLSALVTGWDALLTACKPDVVIADYAPAMLVASRGRVPTIAVSDMFGCPPAKAPRFPNLAGHDTAYDEGELLDIADADLAATGRGALGSLPDLFSADATLVSGFAELDPYFAKDRQHCAPFVTPPIGDGTGGGGDEVFVYGLSRCDAGQMFWRGLAACGRKVRVHMPDPTQAHIALFRQAGIAFEPRPVAFPLIQKRSCIAVSYGGHGFTSACLLAGLPHFVVSYDLEKRLYGGRVDQLGFGRHHDFYDLDADRFAGAIGALADDADMRARLNSAAPSFHARMTTPIETMLVRLLASLGLTGLPV